MADFASLQSRVKKAWRAQASWRKQAESDFAFLAGHQWDEQTKATMEDNNRVPIVFNRVAVIISAVSGSEINNRTEVRFIPREIGDVKPNEVLTAGAEWFRDQADAEDEESQSFEDVLICGLGFTETSLNFEEDDEGAPEVVRIHPCEMGWDANARRKGLQDSNMFFRVRKIAVQDAKDMFEGREANEIDAAWIDGQSTEHVTYDGDQYEEGSGDVDEPEDTVRVVQVQYRTKETSVEFIAPDGQKHEVPASKWKVMTKALPMKPPHRTRTRKVWKQAFLGSNDVLRENQPDPDNATFAAITGMWDGEDKMWYGLLRAMRDPQMYANKWLSQTLHIINSNAKGGVLYEAQAVEDAREFEESWAAADAATKVRAGALSNGMIQPKPQVQMPVALMNLTEFAISSIRDASGVNMELLGLRDADQPGILEYQRKQAAMTTLAKFFDALRFYRKQQGKVILNFLRNHIAPTGRLVRILKEGQEQYVPLALDGDTAKFDVIVDDAPSAPNEKEKSWSVIEAMMPLLQNAGLGFEDWANILEYSPLPSSFVEMVREKAQSAKQNPEHQMMQQLAVEKEKSEIAENMANAQLDQIKAQQLATETQLAPMKVAADLYQPMRAPGSPT